MRQTIVKEEYLENIMLDLKTPAVAQVCALESLLKTSINKFMPEEIDLIKLTLNSCNYSKRLIDTYLTLYKLDNAKITLNYEKFNLSEILNKVLYELDIVIKYNNLKLKITYDKNMIVHADKAHLEHVVQNILYNCVNTAYKSSSIEIKILNNKKRISFEVKYSADYIEPDILKEIFDKQKKYSFKRCRQGIGLGFYLSKEIIKAHFGGMIAKSSPDNINIFGFYIPA